MECELLNRGERWFFEPYNFNLISHFIYKCDRDELVQGDLISWDFKERLLTYAIVFNYGCFYAAARQIITSLKKIRQKQSQNNEEYEFLEELALEIYKRFFHKKRYLLVLRFYKFEDRYDIKIYPDFKITVENNLEDIKSWLVENFTGLISDLAFDYFTENFFHIITEILQDLEEKLSVFLRPKPS